MANTQCGVFFSIVYLFLIIFCFAEEKKVEGDEDVCDEGDGIVLRTDPTFFYKEKPECLQRFNKSKRSHIRYAKTLSTICAGRQRCSTQQLKNLTILPLCDGNSVPSDVRVGYECKPVVPGKNGVFQIQRSLQERGIHGEAYLIMNRTRSDTINRTCHLKAEDSKSVSLTLLSLQLPKDNDCKRSVRIMVGDETASAKYCENNSAVIKNNVLRDDNRPITLEVEMSSGFLWLEVKTEGYLEINCTGDVITTRPTDSNKKPPNTSPKSITEIDNHTSRERTGNTDSGERGSNETADEESQNPKWEIIGSIIGGVAVVVLLTTLVCVFVVRPRWRKRQRSTVLNSTEDANAEYTYIEDSKVCTKGAKSSPVTNVCSNKARPANTSDIGDACYSECGLQHYSSTTESQPSKSPLIQGTPYDTMATLEGEYSHLKRPGEREKVIGNVYDG